MTLSYHAVIQAYYILYYLCNTSGAEASRAKHQAEPKLAT